MSSCDESSINKNYIVQTPTDTDILSACTGFYTNNIYNCTGDTLTLHSNTVSANTINSTVYLSGGTNLLDIFGSLDNYTTGATLIGSTAYFDRSDTLSAYTLDLSSLDVNDTFVSGGTYNEGTTSIDFSGNSLETTFSVSLSGISSNIDIYNTYFVSPTGDDSTAVRGDLHNPFKTITAARNKVVAELSASTVTGSTLIYVYPGNYTDQEVQYENGNFYFTPNTVVTLVQNTTANRTDVFRLGTSLVNTSNAYSANTCNIYGQAKFIVSASTDNFLGGGVLSTNGDAKSHFECDSAYGVKGTLFSTYGNSELKLKANELELETNDYVLTFRDSSKTFIDVARIKGGTGGWAVYYFGFNGQSILNVDELVGGTTFQPLGFRSVSDGAEIVLNINKLAHEPDTGAQWLINNTFQSGGKITYNGNMNGTANAIIYGGIASGGEFNYNGDILVANTAINQGFPGVSSTDHKFNFNGTISVSGNSATPTLFNGGTITLNGSLLDLGGTGTNGINTTSSTDLRVDNFRIEGVTTNSIIGSGNVDIFNSLYVDKPLGPSITTTGQYTFTGTTYDGDLNIYNTPKNDNTLTEILGRNSTTGDVEYRDVESIISAATSQDTFVTGYTYDNANTFNISDNSGNTFNATINTVTGLTVNGDLSATTVSACTGIYTSNLYGCSPVTVHDNLQHISSSATGINSIAWGTGTTASGDFSHAEGQGTIAGTGHTGYYTGYISGSHAEGVRTVAIGGGSHAEGVETTATTWNYYGYVFGGSHAEGFRTTSSGGYSHSEGIITTASGYGSHAEGTGTVASGWMSHAEGLQTTSSGYNSHAEGSYTTASGISSHAGGRGINSGNKIVASGDTSFVHFRQTTSSSNIGAYGDYSVILGGNDHNIGTGSTSSGIFAGSGNTISDDVLRTVVLGGGNIAGTTDDTVYVPYLNINNIDNDDSLTQILSRDNSDGSIKYRDVSSISTDDFYVSGGTYNSSSKEINFTGNSAQTTFDVDLTTLFSSVSGDTFIVSGNADAGNSELTFTYNTGGTITVTNSAALFSDNDINVTGGTYNPSNGCVTFGTNSGTTFDVCGFVTGITDTYTTGSTLVGETIQFDNNILGLNYYNVSLSPVLSGKTNNSTFNTYTSDTQTVLNSKVSNGINSGGGSEIFSGKSGTDLYFRTLSGGSNTTLTTVGDVVKIDVAVPSGDNFFSTAGTVTQSATTGSTEISLQIVGTSGFTPYTITGLTDTFVNDFTFSSNTFTITQNDGSSFDSSVETIELGNILSAVTFDIGTSGSISATTFNGNTFSGGTFYGDGSNLTGITSNDTFVTGFTYDNSNNLTISRNDGTGFTTNFSTMSGLTVNGTLSATTLDGSIILSGGTNLLTIIDDRDTFVTGGTYNPSTVNLDFSGNTGFLPFSVDVSDLKDDTNTFVTGFTYDNINTFTISDNTGSAFTTSVNVLSATTISGGTLFGDGSNLTGISSESTTITGFTYDNANTFTISDSSGTTFDASINIMTGLTVNGESVFSGTSTDVLQIYGSGTTTPIFRVEGSAGELFSISDGLIGDLFTVNNISGLPILVVNSDNTILWGDNTVPSLNTTVKKSINSGLTEIYSVPVSAYTGGFFDYTVTGAGARSGSIMSIFSGTSIDFNETSTNDIGDTSGITFDMNISGGTANLTVSATTNSWEIRTIVRSI